MASDAHGLDDTALLLKCDADAVDRYATLGSFATYCRALAYADAPDLRSPDLSATAALTELGATYRSEGRLTGHELGLLPTPDSDTNISFTLVAMPCPFVLCEITPETALPVTRTQLSELALESLTQARVSKASRLPMRALVMLDDEGGLRVGVLFQANQLEAQSELRELAEHAFAYALRRIEDMQQAAASAPGLG
jgi:hypothetical protein